MSDNEANQRLQESEERCRLMVQGISSHAIFMLDTTGNVITWNSGAERIKGYKAEEILGQHFSRFYTNDDRASDKPQIELQIALEKGCYEEDGWRVQKHGSLFWATVSITPIYNHSPKLIGFVNVVRKITKPTSTLGESAHFNRAILDGLSAHIAILDTDGTITAVNEPWEKFGAANGLAGGRGSVGDNYLAVCDQSSGSSAQEGLSVAAGIRDVLANKIPYFMLEYPCHSPDKQRWFVVRVTRLPGEGPKRVIVAHENITDRKVAEEARGDAEQRLIFALERSQIGAWERNLIDNTVSHTSEHARIFGYESLVQDWSIDRFQEHVLPEDRITVERLIQQSVAAKENLSFECRIRRVDGEVRWIWATAARYCDSEGKPRRIAGIVQDITKRRQVEEDLRDRERLLGIVTESARVGLVVVDSDYRYRFANTAYAEIFCLHVSAIIDKYVPDLLAAGWSQIQPRLDRALAGERVSYELTLPPLIGGQDERYFSVAYEPRTDQNENPTVVVVVVDITARKRIEAEQLKLVKLIELSRDFIGVTNPQGQLTFLNTSGRKLIGVDDKGDVEQLQFTNYISPEQHAFFLETVMRATHEQGHWEGEMQLRHLQTGAYIDVFLSTFLLQEAAGQVQGCATIARNITDQKRAQEAQRASEERLRLMIEGVNDHAIFMLDPKGHIQTWSCGAERITGYTADEMIGRHYSCLFTPESFISGLPVRELELAAADGRASIEDWRVRKNGSRFWATGTLAALYDENHKLKGFTEITRDLTAKRHNDELLHSVLDHTLDSIISIDEIGTITMINRAGERLFGYAASEVIGQNVNMLMPEPYHSEHDAYLKNYLRTGEAKIIGIGREVSGRRKGGGIFPVELAVTEFRLDNRRYFVGIVRDISEKKKLENQLRQAQKMEAIGQLAGGIAHDFNNLLSVIINYSSFSLNSIPPDHIAHKDIQEVLKASERASSLTRQILAFSRKQILTPKILNINHVIQNMESMLQRLIGENIAFSVCTFPSLWNVKADPTQLEQVIMNLAVNARDAMPDGGKLLIETSNIELTHSHLELFSSDRPFQPGCYVLTSVSDSGSGIPSEIIEHIFEPFFTTKGQDQGTGLGLSTVYGIIKQSGGYISVYSEANNGTIFKIYLPRADLPFAPFTSGSPTSSPKGQETILVVEDESSIRRLVARILSTAGYQILTAKNASEAVQICHEYSNNVHLLLTDIVMPRINGKKLATSLLQAIPHLKVLYMSGYANYDLFEKNAIEPSIHFISKPFSASDLTQKIRFILDQPPVNGVENALKSGESEQG